MLAPLVVAAALAACSGPAASSGGTAAGNATAAARVSAASPGQSGTPRLPTAVTRAPAPAVSVLPDTEPGDLTARFARALFRSAPVVVVAARAAAALAAATEAARAAHAPLLLAPEARASETRASQTRAPETRAPETRAPETRAPETRAPETSVPVTAGPAGSPAASASASAALAAAITAVAPLVTAVQALHPVAVLTVGLPSAERDALTASLPGVRVVTRPQGLPATGVPPAQGRVAVLVPAPVTDTASRTGQAGAPGAASAALTAVSVTAQAAGATVIDMPGTDPRTDPAAITDLARQRPTAVVAVGAGFGPAARLASRLTVAETGRQLPGGGQLLFPGRRLVALYGHPGTPGLGVLGQQNLSASVARARTLAAAYQRLSGVPVIPAFEIIATVAEASPGPDGSYSYETPVSELLPWVRTATADGLYVVLDLQPGRASLLAQAEHYQSLLALPDVGLALDPEWKLQPGQRPLRQIGHVEISEVNSVIGWLAALTAKHRLPQKLLVLHQFQLSMLAGEQRLDTSRADLAIVIHMDGQGTPGMKQATWNAVTAAAPRGVFFGWKNFLVKDHPTLTPGQTMTKTPAPVMISYQ
jgi:hypothetical protein